MKKLLRNASVILAAGGVGVYGAYRMVFGRNRKNQGLDTEIPKGKQYDPYAEMIRQNVESVKELHFQRIFIEAKDGITLAGKYYHVKDQAPLIVFFHGYRSGALRDGNGILLYARKMGYNARLVDQRGHGKSGGKTITFGIKERYDCLDWIRYANRRFGEHTQIILAGISMGASTVLMATGDPMPSYVKGIIADCGYTTPYDMFYHYGHSHFHIPMPVMDVFNKHCIKTAGIDLKSYSTLEAMATNETPIFFVHGKGDTFVPMEMTMANYEACKAPKQLLLVDDAPHAMSFLFGTEEYTEKALAFFDECEA